MHLMCLGKHVEGNAKSTKIHSDIQRKFTFLHDLKKALMNKELSPHHDAMYPSSEVFSTQSLVNRTFNYNACCSGNVSFARPLESLVDNISVFADRNHQSQV